MAYLAGLHHEKATDPKIGDLLGAVEGSNLTVDLLAPAAVNVREWRRSFNRLTRLPRDLVEETARTTSLAQHHWIEARKASDFGRFSPWLSKIVALKQREAEYLSQGGPLYDALLDEYEPGAKSQEIATLFAALRNELVPLVAAIANASRRPDASILKREFPIDRQRFFGESLPRPSASTFSAAGSTPRPTHSAPASGPVIAGSPLASTRAASATPSSASCTKPATACTTRGSIPRSSAPRWARPSHSASTSRNRASGRMPSAAPVRSGVTSSPSPSAPSPTSSTTSRSTRFTSPSTKSNPP